MNSSKIYALDFDGVICDSAIETSMTGWKAACKLWPKMPTDISDDIIEQFKVVRPALETGFESILIVRLLFEGVSAQALLNNFNNKIDSIIRRDQLDPAHLKKLFGEVRDHWIQDDLQNWLAMNPLFEGVDNALQGIEQNKCYIITTKQERFVHQILNAFDINLPIDNVFGLDRNMSKQQVLADLVDNYPEQKILFVEDRLPTLVNVLNDQQLSKVELFFAEWGYNTTQDKQQASDLNLNRIDLNGFLSL
jgi:phosphoglycolate phosphatase-like HAD superfamily hydrolase